MVNGEELRVYPTKEYQKLNINKHSLVEVMDWDFYVLPINKNM